MTYVRILLCALITFFCVSLALSGFDGKLTPEFGAIGWALVAVYNIASCLHITVEDIKKGKE